MDREPFLPDQHAPTVWPPPGMMFDLHPWSAAGVSAVHFIFCPTCSKIEETQDFLTRDPHDDTPGPPQFFRCARCEKWWRLDTYLANRADLCYCGDTHQPAGRYAAWFGQDEPRGETTA